MRNKIFISMLIIIAFTNIIFANDIENYKSYLNTLSDTNIASISEAKNKFHTIFNHKNKNSETAYRIFLEKYNRILRNSNNLNKKLQNILFKISDFVPNSLDNPMYNFLISTKNEIIKFNNENHNVINKLKVYLENGIDFNQSEGEWYLVKNYNYLYDIIKNYEFDIKDYIAFMILESKERLAEDGGLCISWESLRKRIQRWENFAKNYPELPETKNRIIPKIENLIRFYIIGIDNSRIYDYKTGDLKSEIKNSYQNFVKQNKNSKYYDLIFALNNYYEESKLQISDQIIKFLEDKGYRVFWKRKK